MGILHITNVPKPIVKCRFLPLHLFTRVTTNLALENHKILPERAKATKRALEIGKNMDGTPVIMLDRTLKVSSSFTGSLGLQYRLRYVQ